MTIPTAMALAEIATNQKVKGAASITSSLALSVSFQARALRNLSGGAIFQVSRKLQVFLQKASQKSDEDRWRPAVVCISSKSFERLDAFNMLRWIAHRFGFGTYIHYLHGYLSRETAAHPSL